MSFGTVHMDTTGSVQAKGPRDLRVSSLGVYGVSLGAGNELEASVLRG